MNNNTRSFDILAVKQAANLGRIARAAARRAGTVAALRALWAAHRDDPTRPFTHGALAKALGIATGAAHDRVVALRRHDEYPADVPPLDKLGVGGRKPRAEALSGTPPESESEPALVFRPEEIDELAYLPPMTVHVFRCLCKLAGLRGRRPVRWSKLVGLTGLRGTAVAMHLTRLRKAGLERVVYAKWQAEPEGKVGERVGLPRVFRSHAEVRR